MTSLLLFVTALIGGALNAVAGGGSFLALPALLYAGVSPVAANATTTLAMWPGAAASVVAYRRELSGARQRLMVLAPVSLIGGLLGAEMLVRTSDSRFLRLLPWLMLTAVVTFTFSGALTRRLRGANVHPSGPSVAVPVWMVVLQAALAIYGGYFGGGIGIMMLAAFSVTGMTNIHEMNGLKTVLAVAINGVALAAFVLEGVIVWGPGLIMVAGGVVGGYAGAAMARRVSVSAVRTLVTVIGWSITTYFFLFR